MHKLPGLGVAVKRALHMVKRVRPHLNLLSHMHPQFQHPSAPLSIECVRGTHSSIAAVCMCEAGGGKLPGLGVAIKRAPHMARCVCIYAVCVCVCASMYVCVRAQGRGGVK